jgi:hypothetical protein
MFICTNFLTSKRNELNLCKMIHPARVINQLTILPDCKY